MKKLTCILLSLCVLACGCASNPFAESAWVEPRPLGSEWNALRPSYSSNEVVTDLEEYAEPSGSMTLRDALVATLLQNPILAASGYEVQAAKAEARQAMLIPNPELGIELENFGGSGVYRDADSLETTLLLSQLVELGGKRLKRYRVAHLESQLAGWEYEIQRIDVLTKTATDFVGMLAAQRRLSIANETLELANRVYNAIGERVDAGKISPVEHSKASVELAQAELVREIALTSIEIYRYRLASNWGSITPKFTTLLGDLDKTITLPDLDMMLARSDQNPDLAKWTSQIALRNAELELALAQQSSDLTLSAGVRSFNDVDETAIVAGVSFPLQVFDRKQGSVQAARLRILKTNKLESSVKLQIHAAIVEAYQSLDAANTIVNVTRDRILPSAIYAFESAEEAFKQGKLGALDLFDTERTLFDAYRQLTDALTNYHLAVIRCEHLIGESLHNSDSTEGTDK